MRILNGISAVSIQSTYDLTTAFRNMGYKADSVIYRSNPLLGNICDVNLNIDMKKIYMMPIYITRVFVFVITCLFKYDIFHFHFGHSLLPFNFDLPFLRALGKKVFMEYHGSDIRRPSIFNKRNEFSFSISLEKERQSYLKQRRIAKYVNGIIVHDSELQENLFEFDVETHIVPLRIDLSRFKVAIPQTEKDEICIVHAPSKKDVKGTGVIIDAINVLSKVYQIDFKLVHGVPYNKALEIYREADVIIDQLKAGTYGMLSIEGMAMGKPVICYLRDDLIEKLPPNIPIINANENNIIDKIESLINDRHTLRHIGFASRKYIEMYHDSHQIARKLLGIYSS